jgi:hypothetical protein
MIFAGSGDGRKDNGMAQLTAKEFEDVVGLLANHLRMDRFHEKLLKANALVSRKRPPSVQVLAGQLYQLSAGLRRNHPARYAIEYLWQDMLAESIKEEHGKTIEALVERINACLTDKLEVIPEKGADLVSALGAYHQAIAALTNDEVAYLEILLRASTEVANFLRDRKNEVQGAATTTATTAEAPAPTETEPAANETEPS